MKRSNRFACQLQLADRAVKAEPGGGGLRSDLNHADAEQLGDSGQVLGPVPGPERPVMSGLGRPGVAPRSRVAAEVDTRGGVADLQERAGTTVPSETTKRRSP